MGNWIAPEECKHGYVYAITSRNLGFGVWREDVQGFVGIREKFGDLFLFTEYHRDTGGMFGTVMPWAEVERCPIEDLREHPQTLCSQHDRPAVFIDREKGWLHVDDGSPLPDDPMDLPRAIMNQPLFDYLTWVEEQNDWDQIIEDFRH